MGLGTSTQQQQTQQQTQTQPWAPAIPALTGLLGLTQGQAGNTGATPLETSAIAGLENNAAGGNPYAAGIGNVTSNLLSGGGAMDSAGYTTGAYNQAQSSLAPIANQSTNPYDNPAFSSYLTNLSSQANDAVKSAYAGEGYAPGASGDYGKQIAQGIGLATAPVFAQAQDTLTNQRANAANSLFNAGTGTTGVLSGLNQNANSNAVTGAGLSGTAIDAKNLPFEQQLSAEAMRRGIPLQNISQLESLIVPMAALGQQSSGTGSSNTTSTASPLQQFLQLTTGLGSLFGKK